MSDGSDHEDDDLENHIYGGHCYTVDHNYPKKNYRSLACVKHSSQKCHGRAYAYLEDGKVIRIDNHQSHTFCVGYQYKKNLFYLKLDRLAATGLKNFALHYAELIARPIFNEIQKSLPSRDNLRRRYNNNKTRKALHDNQERIPEDIDNVKDFRIFLRKNPSVLIYHKKEDRFDTYFQLTFDSSKKYVAIYDKEILSVLKKSSLSIEITGGKKVFIKNSGIIITFFLKKSNRPIPCIWFLAKNKSHLGDVLEKGKQILDKRPKTVYCENQISDAVESVFPGVRIKKNFYFLIKDAVSLGVERRFIKSKHSKNCPSKLEFIKELVALNLLTKKKISTFNKMCAINEDHKTFGVTYKEKFLEQNFEVTEFTMDKFMEEYSEFCDFSTARNFIEKITSESLNFHKLRDILKSKNKDSYIDEWTSRFKKLSPEVQKIEKEIRAYDLKDLISSSIDTETIKAIIRNLKYETGQDDQAPNGIGSKETEPTEKISHLEPEEVLDQKPQSQKEGRLKRKRRIGNELVDSNTSDEPEVSQQDHQASDEMGDRETKASFRKISRLEPKDVPNQKPPSQQGRRSNRARKKKVIMDL